jgi:hypothetical protein
MSKKITQGPVKQVGQRLGSGNRAANPGGADALGQFYGSHGGRGDVKNPRGATPLYGGAALNPTPLGNAVAQATQCGPGGSRNIYGKGGTQQQYGAARGPERDTGPDVPSGATGKDILGSYGKDYKGGGRGL